MPPNPSGPVAPCRQNAVLTGEHTCAGDPLPTTPGEGSGARAGQGTSTLLALSALPFPFPFQLWLSSTPWDLTDKLFTKLLARFLPNNESKLLQSDRDLSEMLVFASFPLPAVAHARLKKLMSDLFHFVLLLGFVAIG